MGPLARRRKPLPAGLCHAGPAIRLVQSRQGVPAARYGRDSKTVRPVRFQRLDLEQKRGRGLVPGSTRTADRVMNSHCKTEPTDPLHYVPLDVSKRRLDYGLEPGQTAAVANTREGIATLIKHLEGHPQARVVCESSGGYERALLAALGTAKIAV